jgi:hypothetical protein
MYGPKSSLPKNYGQINVSSPTNLPPHRYNSATWNDQLGNLYFFGGDLYNDVQFSITKIIGSKKDKTITITFLYENNSFETRDFLQCQEASAIDARGNQFQTYEVYVAPNKNMRAEKIKSNIPIKGNFVFNTEETDFPILRIVKILVYPKDNMSSPKEAIFENIAVIWE